MNIVLIGYRGTGKSSAGKLLAQRLGLEVVSTDAEIVRRAGLSIPEIVQRHGWDHFRDLESDVCREVAERDGLIIDTGGGAILRPANVACLKKTGTCVWLTARVPTIVRRIGGDTQRPSLTGTRSFTEEVEEILREREPRYQAAADHVIETDDRPLAQVVEAILTCLQSR
ncbi:MAG: shikimate kinase [Nitrospirales bacterium]